MRVRVRVRVGVFVLFDNRQSVEISKKKSRINPYARCLSVSICTRERNARVNTYVSNLTKQQKYRPFLLSL